MITPSLADAYNQVGGMATTLEVAQNILYITNAHFTFKENRRFFLIMNARGAHSAAATKTDRARVRERQLLTHALVRRVL